MSDEYPQCTVCGRRKKPMGRDAGIGIDSWCHNYRDGFGCEGYMQDPQPVQHWPGEADD